MDPFSRVITISGHSLPALIDPHTFKAAFFLYPPEAIDYVVVHELAHIRHHDHSPAFYALIERYMPDWRERMKLLKE